MGAIREWITVIGVALLIAFVVRGFVLQQFYISGPSMESTMFQNNRVLVNKLSYRLHDIHRGDVVVFDRVTTDGVEVQHDDLIKRVIGLPGETLTIANCVVSINGTVLDEPWLGDQELDSTLEPGLRCGSGDVGPTTMGEMAGWFEALGSEGAALRAYFVTVDPARDTPEILDGYVSWVSDRITALTGPQAEIDKIVKAWAAVAERVDGENGDYTMNHTASVYLINPQGGFEGTIAYGENQETAVAKIRKLLGKA